MRRGAWRPFADDWENDNAKEALKRLSDKHGVDITDTKLEEYKRATDGNDRDYTPFDETTWVRAQDQAASVLNDVAENIRPPVRPTSSDAGEACV